MILKNEKIFPLSSAPDLRSLVGGGRYSWVSPVHLIGEKYACCFCYLQEQNVQLQSETSIEWEGWWAETSNTTD